MLSDGIYSVAIARTKKRNAKQLPDSEALAVLRGGTILGSDPWGGVFTGTYAECPATGKHKVHVSFDVPPEGELITGFAAGPDGAHVELDAAFRKFVRDATTVATLDGKPLRLTVSFVGPLPNSGCTRLPTSAI